MLVTYRPNDLDVFSACYPLRNHFVSAAIEVSPFLSGSPCGLSVEACKFQDTDDDSILLLRGRERN